MKNKLPASGFTLIELMVVMTVIAILATMALYGLGKAQASARDASRQQIMTGIQTALERYYGDNQLYFTATNNFCGLTTAMVGGNYLSAQPVDPGTKLAICGTGNPCTDASANCATGAQYTYLGAAQSYVLTLKKESGGTNNFNSPQ